MSNLKITDLDAIVTAADEDELLVVDVSDTSDSAAGSSKKVTVSTLKGVLASHTHELTDISDLTATATEVNYTDGVTSNIQTQLDAKGVLDNVVEDTSPQLGGDLDINDKYIQLDPVPASDHTGNGLMASVTVDSNSTGIGALLYMASDGNYDEADADSTTTAPVTALALESGTGTKKILLQGYFRDDSWTWTPGGLLYLSTVTGALTQTAPSATDDVVQVIGYATHADRIYFDPQLTMVVHS